MAGKLFLKGAVILAGAGVVVKILGAFFRIPLANMIGDTGMGYYQTAYPIYVLLLALTTSGIPTAIARLVSERTAEGNHREAYRIFRLSFGLLAVIGFLSFVFLEAAAPWIASFSSEHAVYAIRAIAPALLIIPIMAAFRGYFQGLQDMTPTAVSQIAEQLFRVICGLALAYILLPQGVDRAAAGASFGAAAGGACGLFAIFIIYTKRKSSLRELWNLTPADAGEEASGRILRRIVGIAVPITIGASIMSVMSLIDLLMVKNRLVDAGFTAEAANSLYGQLSGFATPLINLPQVLTQSVALSLVPAIAAAYSLSDQDALRRNVQLGMRTSMLIGLPCGIGLLVLSEPLMLLLYPAQRESALSAAGCMSVLAVGVIFLASVQTLTGILQGVSRQTVPVINLTIGALVKAVITYTLTAVPDINIKGAAAGTVCAYLIATVLNVFAVTRATGIRFGFIITFLKPGMAALLMGGAVLAVYQVLSGFGLAIAVLLSVAVGVVVYAALIFCFRAITAEELKELPGGMRILRLLGKGGH